MERFGKELSVIQHTLFSVCLSKYPTYKMVSNFNYQYFFRLSPTNERPFWAYDGEDDEYPNYILEQFGDVDRNVLPELYFDELVRVDDGGQHHAINREAINAFLTRVCAMIDVDPAEAIAQNFDLYIPMVEWLRSRYHAQVIDLYEAKLERYYQAIYPQMVVPPKIQTYYRNIIDHSAWWDSTIRWILDLQDTDHRIQLRFFPEENDENEGEDDDF